MSRPERPSLRGYQRAAGDDDGRDGASESPIVIAHLGTSRRTLVVDLNGAARARVRALTTRVAYSRGTQVTQYPEISLHAIAAALILDNCASSGSPSGLYYLRFTCAYVRTHHRQQQQQQQQQADSCPTIKAAGSTGYSRLRRCANEKCG